MRKTGKRTPLHGAGQGLSKERGFLLNSKGGYVACSSVTRKREKRSQERGGGAPILGN